MGALRKLKELWPTEPRRSTELWSAKTKGEGAGGAEGRNGRDRQEMREHEMGFRAPAAQRG